MHLRLQEGRESTQEEVTSAVGLEASNRRGSPADQGNHSWGCLDTIFTVSGNKQGYWEALFGKTDLSERLLSLKPEG